MTGKGVKWLYTHSCVLFHFLGAFGIERKALGRDTKIVVTTRSHETEAVRNAIAACEPTEVVRVGGAGHKVGIYYPVL